MVNLGIRMYVAIDKDIGDRFTVKRIDNNKENVCNRGGYCNFMHLKKNRELRKQLFGRDGHRHSRSRSRSRSPYRPHGYEERPHGGRGFGRRDDDRDNRYQLTMTGEGGLEAEVLVLHDLQQQHDEYNYSSN